MSESSAELSWGKYRIRTCRSMHECQLCGNTINMRQRYHDGGGARRAHVACVNAMEPSDAGNIIHVLREGVALCGTPGFPCHWPRDHTWVRIEDWPEVLQSKACPHCRVAVEARKHKVQREMSIKRAKVRVTVELETGETFESDGKELVISAHDYERQLRTAAEMEVRCFDQRVRDTLLGYGPKGEA